MQRKKRTPWIFASEPPQNPPMLTSEQKRTITALCTTELSDDDWKDVENARTDFSWCCWARHHSFEYKQLQKRLQTISSASRSLMTALTHDPSTNAQFPPTEIPLDRFYVAMGILLNTPKRLPFTILDFLRQLNQLQTRALQAINAHHEMSKNDAWQHDWNLFVSALASIFERSGVSATAAKWGRAQNAKLSPFVRFVQAIGATLQPEYQEHVQSQAAMAKAVADALASRRKTKPGSAGPMAAAD